MAEQIKLSANPIQDARAWITRNETLAWTFTRWINALKYPEKIAGLSGTLVNGKTFTLRYDWDAEHGYHVNAMVGSDRRLYKNSQVMKFDTEIAAIQRYDTLTQKVSDLGPENAAQWFMNGDE
ncbi:hypothetical protein KCU65_g2621, partial [Aureobasidium melanogenum]